jgi:DNA-binding MarR family transcriptional regulator
MVQIQGEEFVRKEKPRVKSLSAGAFGFSFGLTFTDETDRKYGFRAKLSLLADALAKHDKGILILVDEVQASGIEMRELATTYQHLIGEQKNIAIAMAGLPIAVSSVLNDKMLTFLHRANKVKLGPIALSAIQHYYMNCFARVGKSIDGDLLEKAVSATRGYPYLLQLAGYYILEYAGDANKIEAEVVDAAIRTAKHALIENVHRPSLMTLSDRDIDFLSAMAKDSGDSQISDIAKRLGVDSSYAQQYRKRLIEAGVIASGRRGRIEFTVPYLGEYLRKEL